jgi:hypothetical protein
VSYANRLDGALPHPLDDFGSKEPNGKAMTDSKRQAHSKVKQQQKHQTDDRKKPAAAIGSLWYARKTA